MQQDVVTVGVDLANVFQVHAIAPMVRCWCAGSSGAARW